MLVAARETRRVAGRPVRGGSPEETALQEWNAQPQRWASLARILRGDRLLREWRDMYVREWHAGSVENYLAGVAWVWEYYSGRPVDQAWWFEEHLPPLWESVAATLRTQKEDFVRPPAIAEPEPLPAWLHLLAVLPAESVERLLPASRGSALIQTAPWYWPTQWSLFDIGRTQLWECEPVIPVMPDSVLRSWVKR